MGIGKDEEEREVTLQELKDIIFKNASDELDGWIHARSYLTKEQAEFQHQRYIAIFQIIGQARLNFEYQAYRKMAKK